MSRNDEPSIQKVLNCSWGCSYVAVIVNKSQFRLRYGFEDYQNYNVAAPNTVTDLVN